MEFLFEFLFELFFEAPVEIAMSSRRLKRWVKTLLFSLVGAAVSVLLALAAFSPPVTIEIVGVFVLWTIFVIVGAVIGHRSNWKHCK